jgi:6-phosphogluconolactonase
MADTGITLNSQPREIQPGVFVYADAAAVARAAARQFVEWAWQSISRHGDFQVALAGGNTPQEMYRQLATPEFRSQVDWAKVQVFWGDERCVPPDHAESNYGIARRELLLRVPVPPANVHRMEAERASVGRAAQDYEDVLRANLDLNASGFPRFHLILLGLGLDGHTASLFPDNRRLRETTRWVSTPVVHRLHARRMTLTLPVLNAAYAAMFLVVGDEKAEILQAVLEGKRQPPYPSQRVTLPEGRRIFLVDQAAGRLLPSAALSGSSAGATHGKKTHPQGEKSGGKQ